MSTANKKALMAALVFAVLLFIFGLAMRDRAAAVNTQGKGNEYTLEKQVQTADGNDCRITVAYGADAGLPKDIQIKANEMDPHSGSYQQYMRQAMETLGVADAGSIRLFDISLTNDRGEEYQPAKGAKVKVSFKLEGLLGAPRVLHFGDEIELLSARVENDTVSFETGGFSVYAVVDAPTPVTQTIQTVTDKTELTDNVGFYLSYNGTNNYFSNALNNNNCFIEVTASSNAAVWYFEPDGSNYKIYTYVNGQKNI